ncbi:MAG: spirocyclase AveC family protein [Panacagrimonas sp.]
MSRVMTAPASVDTRRKAKVAAQSKPVYLFAAWGVISLCIGLFAMGSWLGSADFKPSPMGPDPLPNSVWWTLRITEVVALSCAVWLLWKFMIKPWRQTGKLGWDGMFMISGFLLWWTDPIDNYFNFTFMYNTGFFNMGSWTRFIPGWEAPNQHLFPEPLFFVGGLYIWWFIAPVAIGCWAMRKLQEARPDYSMMTRLGIMFGAFMVFDFIAEGIFQYLEIFKYVGTYAPLTVFAGTEHQYPLYNSVIMAMFFMGMTSLRYFRDDKGNSWAEKGIDQVQLPAAGKSVLRQFAIMGFLSANIMIMYYTPYLLFSMKVDSFPQYPSYLTADICGERSAYACPGREVPIPKRGSIAIAPDDPRLSDTSK